MIMPQIMGVVNVTPDSFSDGGLYQSIDAAIVHALALVQDGAHILDVGGESTRPGADPVSERHELQRVIPVIAGIRSAGVQVPISIDTSKALVAKAAVEAGASIVNDVTAGLGSPEMMRVVAELGVPYIVMHMQGKPRTMQESPTYGNVVEEVFAFLRERVDAAKAQGIAKVWVDVGIGFGKTVEHNLELLRNLTRFNSLGNQVLGLSRKRFLGAIAGVETPAERDAATMIMHTCVLDAGCSVLRVHNVEMARQMLALANALRGET